MKRLTGVAASPGTAVAPAYVHRPDVYEMPEGPVDDPDRAVVRLGEALEGIAAGLEGAAVVVSGAPGDILRAQAAMARDPALRAAATEAILGGEQPSRAILEAGERFARQLEETGNEYLAARGPDVRHICDLTARALVGAPPRVSPHPVESCVLVADDLSPADTATLDAALVRGLATAAGSRTSHTSVVAQGLGIPAVVGVRGLLDSVEHGQLIGIDGTAGEVVIDPDHDAAEKLAAAGAAHRIRRERLRVVGGTGPVTTADGHRVEVAANVGSVEELRAALAEGAEGVGLLRTELLYIDRDRPPTVEEQSALLGEMHALLGSRRLLVRTFDIGADKHVPFLPVRPERNPELGLRGIRLGRAHPELLDDQLRAIAATASLGPTALMAPMVASVDEARWFVERARGAGIPSSVEIGVMVEVPALALVAAELAGYVDFLSIGTNDLTQYLNAADRRDPDLAPLLDAYGPALLRIMNLVCRGATGRCWVGVCGEAASDPAWALLAVGFGVTELSMQGVAIPEVRAAVRRATLEGCRRAAALALRAIRPEDARMIARELMEVTT